MTTFKEISGQLIKTLTSDPEYPQEGQIWYNSTLGVLRGVDQIEAWSTGGNLITARGEDAGGAGIQTAALMFGGYAGGTLSLTEEYNGSGWSNGGNLNTARYSLGGCGTQTAGMAVAGYAGANSNATEWYDGSTWTTQPGTVNDARRGDPGLAGIQTAAVLFGGGIGPGGTATGDTETFNGTIWSNVNPLNTARAGVGNAGTLTAALAFGGSGGSTATESWNGTSWTTLNSMNTARGGFGGNGTQTAALAGGGYTPATPSATGATETWDGTSWTTSPATLGTPREQLSSAGAAPSSAAVVFGGNPITSSTEEYNRSANQYFGAAWASGGILATARTSLGGAGTQTTALAFGGYTGTANTAATEEYGGASWSSGGNLGTARRGLQQGGFGIQTAAAVTGGYITAASNLTEEYDGSTWTAGGTYPTSDYEISQCGILTAGLALGGATFLTSTNEYDGSAWTAGGTLNTGRNAASSFGTQTAGVVAGGYNGTARTTETEEYNGTAWTVVNPINLARFASGASGIQTAGLLFGGTIGGGSLQSGTEEYDGSIWITSASLATAKESFNAGEQSGTAAIAFGGGAPTVTNTTEEYSAAYSDFNIKTLTTS